MYQYKPLSFRSLCRLIEHDVGGQRARFERFVADHVYVIAAGRRIDEVRSRRFSDQMEDVYRNPFDRQPELRTTEQIKQHVLALLEG